MVAITLDVAWILMVCGQTPSRHNPLSSQQKLAIIGIRTIPLLDNSPPVIFAT